MFAHFEFVARTQAPQPLVFVAVLTLFALFIVAFLCIAIVVPLVARAGKDPPAVAEVKFRIVPV